MIDLALLGCAHIHTPGFIKRIKARSDVRVKTVWDPDAARAQKNAAELGAAVVPRFEQALEDRSVGAVVICSETDLHQALVLAAAAARKPMFAEKPLGLGAADSWAMAAAIEKAGVLFQTGYFNRGVPAHRFVREQIALGNFGRITRVRHSNCHKGSLGGWFDTDWRWMADPKRAGCGAFGDLGTHALDILLWLLGDVDSVAAAIQPVTRRYGECDESGEALIRFRNGAIGTLAAGWVDLADPVRLMVSGTEGYAVVMNGNLFFQSARVPGADGKEPWTQLPEPWPHAFDLFLDAVCGKAGVPLVTPREAAYCVAVMEAMYEAGRRGTWVKPAGC